MERKVNIKFLSKSGAGAFEVIDADQRDPFDQYCTLRLKKDGVFLIITGANLKSDTKNKVVSFRVYDMQADEGIREMHIVYELYSDGTIRAKTNLGTTISKKLFLKLWGSRPYLLMLMLATAEELYAKQQNIEHIPTIRKNYIEDGKGKNFKSSARVEDFFELFPEIFKFEGSLETEEVS